MARKRKTKPSRSRKRKGVVFTDEEKLTLLRNPQLDEATAKKILKS
jgi:hypothetical protein